MNSPASSVGIVGNGVQVDGGFTVSVGVRDSGFVIVDEGVAVHVVTGVIFTVVAVFILDKLGVGNRIVGVR